MALDFDKVESTIGKLRKQLKRMAEVPSPDEVHKLRTQTRRVEAIVHAFALEREPEGRKLLKLLKPVRRAAGKVRDLDVFVGFGLETAMGESDPCAVRLVETLSAKRVKLASALFEVVGERRGRTRRLLKRCRNGIEENDGASGSREDAAMPLTAMSTALGLATELREWPKLMRGNLHLYRLKVKELRYVLELAKGSGGEAEFVRALTEVKDAIGAWHDWQELVGIAQEVLQDEGCGVMVRIRGRVKAEFEHAMELANSMRGTFLEGSGSRRRPAGRKGAEGAFPGSLMKSINTLAR